MRLARIISKLLETSIAIPVIIKTKKPKNAIDIFSEYRLRYSRALKLLQRIAVSIPASFAEELFTRLLYEHGMCSLILTNRLVERLADDKRVEKIYLNDVIYVKPYKVGGFVFTTTYETRKLMGFHEIERVAVKGEPIAVVDTGIAFYTKGLGLRRKDIIYDTVFTAQYFDYPGHGTWIASALISQEIRAYGKIKVKGMLPALKKLIVVKALGYLLGIGSKASVIAGITKAVEYGAKVVNLSLGAPVNISSVEDDAYYEVIKKYSSEGVIFVAAAGNEGPEPGTINTPAWLDNVLAVGCYDTIANEVAKYSSRGPTPDGRVKPDVLAPGHRILSSTVGQADFTDLLVNGYGILSGTSMATPHVSALVSAMADVHKSLLGKSLTINEIQEMLRRYAEEKNIVKDNIKGYGLITWDIYKWWIETEYGYRIY